ncbi:hypothetical protein DNI29_12130 [Hymenobacter sediminis]|uniref:hypothetical protein n=1 Tax=Hymenobacter sediminis TaxID=2218621 RepID=UPI000F4D3362|nr:hypothetical protein [Hymenobacter sediminis]RPD46903.1 hypothetical protein DNI29_12130 [Hymenobacter sediminis]
MLANVFGRAVNKARQIYIGLKQQSMLKSQYEKSSDFVVFLVPGYEVRSGGILSIFSFYRETKKMLSDRAVLMASYPGYPKIEKYTWFNNDVYVYSFDSILGSIKGGRLLLHIPEYYVEEFVYKFLYNKKSALTNFDIVNINIMNQNIEYMPKVESVQLLAEFADELTLTNAHEKYTTPELRSKYGIPVHLLASWYDQEPIEIFPYEGKKNKVIVSPDNHPDKAHILEMIKAEFPELDLIVIKNMRYDDFKALEKEAKWGISFGEGLDGYFAGLVLRGGIGFAVYNENFFTQEYKELPTVAKSYSEFGDIIVRFIKENDKKDSYENVNKHMYSIISNQFNYNDYVNNIKKYYNRTYTIS